MWSSGGRRYRPWVAMHEVLPDDWTTTANVIRETGRRVLGVSTGRKVDKETW